MFWKKDFWTRSQISLMGVYEHYYPMWRDEKVITERLFEKSQIRQERLEQKLNLILEELGKEYVPETEKKEPAKLVDREDPFMKVFGKLGNRLLKEEELSKQKKGRPKGSKNKK